MKSSIQKQSEANISQNNISISTYEGIVPSPEMLEKYKKIDTRFADLFYEGAKQYLTMRTENEKISVKASSNAINKSMFYAFSSVFCICSLGGYGFYLGY